MSEGDAEAARIAWVKRAVCDGLNLEEGLRGRVARPERQFFVKVAPEFCFQQPWAFGCDRVGHGSGRAHRRAFSVVGCAVAASDGGSWVRFRWPGRLMGSCSVHNQHHAWRGGRASSLLHFSQNHLRLVPSSLSSSASIGHSTAPQNKAPRLRTTVRILWAELFTKTPSPTY